MVPEGIPSFRPVRTRVALLLDPIGANRDSPIILRDAEIERQTKTCGATILALGCDAEEDSDLSPGDRVVVDRFASKDTTFKWGDHSVAFVRWPDILLVEAGIDVKAETEVGLGTEES